VADKELKAKYVVAYDGAGAKAAQKGMSDLDKSAKTMSDSFDKHTSAIGGMFSSLSSTMAGFGLPFTGSLDRMSQHLDQAKSSGKGYGQVLSDLGGATLLTLGGGFIAVGGESLKMAANFQESMTQLVTGAGESEAGLKVVSQGILDMAGQVGESTSQLAQGMYMIESAGYHGAAGLNVLKASAEGAKVGNADLQTVADGVTTLLTDYKIPASEAATVTSKLVETVASGKTKMQDLAGALAQVAPAASAAHVDMNQLLGAMATMTAAGTPAADAATQLKQTILQLSNPSAKAKTEMQSLGLNANDVSQNLGKRGLTGTFDLLTQAIAAHTSGGTVLIQQMQKAAAAGSGWQTELARMTPVQQAQIDTLAGQGQAMEQYKLEMASLTPAQRSLVTAMENGATGTKTFKAAWEQLAPAQQQQISQLAGGAKAFAEYNAQVAALPAAYKKVLAGATASKEGYKDLTTTIAALPPVEQTQIGALADMVGGTKSMQAALELTGSSASTFRANVGTISKASADSKGNVQGWSTAQKDLNVQLDQAKGTAEKLGIEFGTKLIPVVEHLMNDTIATIGWFEKHKDAAYALAAVIGGALSVAVGAFAVNKVVSMVKGVQQAASAMGDFAGKVGSSATTVLEKFGVIGTGSDEMAAKVEADTKGMAASVEADTTAMASQAEASVAGMDASASASASGMEAKVSASAAGMEAKVSADAGAMAAKVDAATAGMEATVSGDTAAMEARAGGAAAGMEAKVVGSAEGMAAQTKAAVGGMTGAVDADVAAMDSTVAAGAASAESSIAGAEAAAGATPGVGQAAMAVLGAQYAGYQAGQYSQKNQGTLGGSVAGGVGAVLTPGASLLGQTGASISDILHFKIPHLAEGGLVTKPTLMVAGESGQEAVVPLGNLSTEQPGGLPGGMFGGAGGAQVVNISLVVGGPVFNWEDFARQAMPAMRNALMMRSQVGGTSTLTL
jgi:TP901 family phage tail tape measure protein